MKIFIPSPITNLDSVTIILDLKKAFDTVDDIIFLNEISTKKKQQRVQSGMQQVSILGPFSFIFYLNDLSVIEQSNNKLDLMQMTQYSKRPKNSAIQRYNQRVFVKANAGLTDNGEKKTTLNRKTKTVIFGRKPRKYKEHLKLLIFITTSKIKNRMLQFFGLFYQIRKYLILKQINIVYKTIIQPVLQY